MYLILSLALWIMVNCEIPRVLLAAEVSERRLCYGILLGKGVDFPSPSFLLKGRVVVFCGLLSTPGSFISHFKSTT